MLLIYVFLGIIILLQKNLMNTTTSFLTLSNFYSKKKIMNLNSSFTVEEEGEFFSFPSFANQLIELGERIWEMNNEEEQTVIVLSVPSIRHVTALIALGAVKSAIKEKLQTQGTELDFEDWAKRVGQAVEFNEASGKAKKKLIRRKGVIDEVDEFNGKKRLLVRYQEDSYITKRRAFYTDNIQDLSLLEDDVISETEMFTGRGQRIGRTEGLEFLNSMFSYDEVKALYTGFHSGIKVIDNMSRFIMEIEKRELTVGDSSYELEDIDETDFERVLGSMGHIIRPDCMSFYENSFNIAFRSSAKNKTCKLDKEDKDKLVLLGGSKAVTSNVTNRKPGCVVAVLDRTENDYADSEDVVNDAYRMRSDSIEVPVKFHPAIRTMGFKRTR